MSLSYTTTETRTFTIAHARHMAAKVATDLKRIQRLYGKPSDEMIAKYEIEAIVLLRAGYLGSVTYGFYRNGSWIEPTLRYTAQDLAGASAADDDPGGIKPGANINGAGFHSYLVCSQAWWRLGSAERENFQNSLPFYRSSADESPIDGYLDNDRIYSAGGRALDRSSLRSYG